MVPVVDHDDVAIRRLACQSRRQAIRTPLTTPVKVPHPPRPTGQPIPDLIETAAIRAIKDGSECITEEALDSKTLVLPLVSMKRKTERRLDRKSVV